MIVSRLEMLQRSVFELLRDRRELAGIDVLNYHHWDSPGLLDVFVREQVSLCAVVLPPIPTGFRHNWPVPCDAVVEVRILVVENVFVNALGGSALAIAEFIHSLLTGHRLQCGDIRAALIPKLNEPWKINENFSTDRRLEIQLTFECEIPFPWNNGKENNL
jgi:hypothetical protein